MNRARWRRYDKSIEAASPMETCAKAVTDAETANVAETEEQMDPMKVPDGASQTPVA